MAKSNLLIIAAVAVVAVVIGASAVAVLSGNNGDNRDTYYFYLSSDDTSIQGWHSAQGDNAADGFANAMKKDNIKFEISQYGYVNAIGSVEGAWFIAQYLYNNTSSDAAENSILYPIDSYGSFGGANGWAQVNGYDKTGYTGDKLCEIDAKIFFMTPYNPDYTHGGPDSDKGWMTTGPFASTVTFNKEEMYYFYISSDDASIKGWHSAKGTDAAKAFEAAMKNDNIKFEVGSNGYLSGIGDVSGMWYTVLYIYSDMTKEAAQGSIAFPVDSYGSFARANGWAAMSGYDSADAGNKFSEFESNFIFLAPYNPDYTHAGPVSDQSWMTTGPFA